MEVKAIRNCKTQKVVSSKINMKRSMYFPYICNNSVKI